MINANKEEKKSIWGVKLTTATIVFMGLMVATEIILERLLVFDTPITRFSFTFVARATAGACFGPLPAATIGVVSDLLGAFLKGYSPNPGITLAALIRGLIYGFLLFRRKSRVNTIIAAVSDQLVCGLIITTASLCFWSGVSFTTEFFMTRVVQAAIMLPIQIVVLLALQRVLFPRLKTLVAIH